MRTAYEYAELAEARLDNYAESIAIHAPPQVMADLLARAQVYATLAVAAATKEAAAHLHAAGLP